MARNKQTQERAAKKGEIVAAARTLFIDQGFEATAMGQIAESAGVTANTIYWYFGDKDDVLIAVLDDVLEDALREYQEVSTRTGGERLFWVVERLEKLNLLVKAVHARVGSSPSLNEWHDRFHAFVDALIAQDLGDPDLQSPNTDAAVKIIVFTIEGLITHPMKPAEQRQICDALAGRWMAD